MKMISQLTLLIYSILWEDKMSTGKTSFQVMSKKNKPSDIYTDLWWSMTSMKIMRVAFYVYICAFFFGYFWW